MAWNYRVMRHAENGASNEEPYYAIHEVYYAADNSVRRWTEEFVGCSGETLDELSRDVAWYLTALVKPVLDASSGLEVEPARLLEDDLYAMLDSPGAEGMREAIRNRAASADTHPKGGDVQQAPSPMSGAVGDSRDAQPPSGDS